MPELALKPAPLRALHKEGVPSKCLLTGFPSSRLSNPYNEFREAAGDSNRETNQAISGGVEAWSLPPSNPGWQLVVLWSELAASDDVPNMYRGRTVVPVRARANILRKTRQARSLHHRPWRSVDACSTERMHQPCREMLPSKPRPAARGDEVDKPMEETLVDLVKALGNANHEYGCTEAKGRQSHVSSPLAFEARGGCGDMIERMNVEYQDESE